MEHFYVKFGDSSGGAENGGPENAGPENEGPSTIAASLCN